MEKSIQGSLDEMSTRIDVLIRQIANLNEALRDNKLENIYSEILDSNEAARYLKVTTQFLRTLRDKQEVKYYQRDQLIRYKKADLDKWLTSHQVGR
jgi:hypothetical protein